MIDLLTRTPHRYDLDPLTGQLRMMTEGNLLGALLLAVLPVLLPELRLWVEMLRDRSLQDRLDRLESDLKNLKNCRCSRRPRAEFVRE